MNCRQKEQYRETQKCDSIWCVQGPLRSSLDWNSHSGRSRRVVQVVCYARVPSSRRPWQWSPACPRLSVYALQSFPKGLSPLKCTALYRLMVALSIDGPQEIKQNRQERWIIKDSILTTKSRLQQVLTMPTWHPLSPPDFAILVVDSSWLSPSSSVYLSSCLSPKLGSPPVAQKCGGVNTPGAAPNHRARGQWVHARLSRQFKVAPAVTGNTCQNFKMCRPLWDFVPTQYSD